MTAKRWRGLDVPIVLVFVLQLYAWRPVTLAWISERVAVIRSDASAGAAFDALAPTQPS